MKLTAFIERLDHVCYRYRVAAFTAALAEREWTLEAVPLAETWTARLAQFRAAAAADVVLWQRRLIPLWQAWYLRRCARRLVFDFDDAVLYRDSFSGKAPTSWSRSMRFATLVRSSDLVLAGNAFLAELAQRHTEASRVRYVPTVVDPGRYAMAPHAGHSGPLRLVWIGQRSTLPYLMAAADCLQAAARAVPNLELHVVSDVFPEIEGVRIVRRAWSAAGEARYLASADVGLSWLTDDDWSRGKCGLKVLQYMAAGLPVVANRVGLNGSLVEHDRSGLLSDTPREWAASLSRLAADASLRARLGEAGRRRVERDYSVESWAPRFVALIDELGVGSRHLGRFGAMRPHVGVSRARLAPTER